MRGARTGVPKSWVPKDGENRMAEFRVQAGMTIACLASKIGVASDTLRFLELHRTAPTDRHGNVKPWVIAACKVLHRAIEDVFPFEFCAWRQDEFVHAQMFGAFMCREPQDIDGMIDARDAVKALYKAKPRHALVLWAVCCGYTCDEIGAEMGLSRTRVSQMEGQAIRWLRGPGRIGHRELGERVAEAKKPWWEDDDVCYSPHRDETRYAEIVGGWSARALWVRSGKVGPQPHP